MLDRNYMTELFGKAGMEINNSRFERLERYAELLCDWNGRINLTAITDAEGIALKHFFDSVYPFTLFDLPENARLIDVGTGAGFPSCPLKIFRDDISLTLLDSLNKRIKFLEVLSQECSLGAECIHSRAEDGGRASQLRERFDTATARAVAPFYILAEYCLPFVKVGGSFIALKGSNGMAELDEARENIRLLGGEIAKVKEYVLPNGDGRIAAEIKKVKPTPSKYPRAKAKITIRS